MKSFSFLTIFWLFLSCHSPQNPTNVLLIMVDDMGYGDMGLSGNPILKTPILDSLARKGTQFSHFYVSSVCAPTRASLLTGRYHQRTGVRSVTNGFETMNPNETTLAEILKANGYRTGIFGKWHLGEYYPSLPNAQGFDEFIGFRTGHTDDYFDPTLLHNGKPENYQGYITDVLTDEALKFMGSSQNPFFCYLPYNAPHTPLQVDSQWFQPYLDQGLEDREARVYGMMANIDHNMGRMIRELKNKGILEHTLVIFISDNGPINGWRVPQEEMRFNAGLRDQKFTIYEGGIRTQNIWLWPDQIQRKPQIFNQIAAHIDVLPTVLEVLDISLPDSLKIDGMSLIAATKGKSDSHDSRLFFQNYSLETLREPAPFPGGIVRKGNWKMVNGEALYDLSKDVGEKENLADEHPQIMSELREAYLTWYEDVHAEMGFFPRPIPVGYPEASLVEIKPHHGKATGNLQFLGKRGLEGEKTGSHPTGVDGDWIGNWQKSGDQITWEIEVVTEGKYEILANLRGKTGENSCKIKVLLNSEIYPVTLYEANDSENWQPIHFTYTPLRKGTYTLTIQLDAKDPQDWFEIESLILKLV